MGALGHEDREGVEDDERADDDAERGEAEQQAGEEVDELADVLVVALHDLLGIEHLVRRAQTGAQRAPELRDGHAGVAAHVHRVESVPRRRRSPARWQVEGEERERTGVGVAESEHAHEVERPARVRPTARRRCPRRGPRPPCGVDVDHDLVGAPGARLRVPPSSTSSIGPVAPAHERHAGRGHALVDGFAVTADELRVALHEAACRRHAVDVAHLVDDGLGHAGAVVVAAHRRTPHDDVDVGQGLLEHALERLVEGVGQHVGRGDEHDAEEHRGRGRARDGTSVRADPGARPSAWDDQSTTPPRRQRTRPVPASAGRSLQPAAGVQVVELEEPVEQLHRDRALARPPTPPGAPRCGAGRRRRTLRARWSRARAVPARAARRCVGARRSRCTRTPRRRARPRPAASRCADGRRS